MLSTGSCQNQDNDGRTNLSELGDIEHVDEDRVVIKQVLNILSVEGDE